MRILTIGLRLAAVALFGASCGSSGGRDAISEAFCSSPAAADTFDAATSVGCEPEPAFQICEVQSGAVLNPDGTYTPAATCSNPCAPGEYALRCTGSIVDGVLTAMPSPAPGLGCEPLPVPTPLGLAIYCCACARGG